MFLKPNADQFERIRYKPNNSGPWYTFIRELQDYGHKIFVSTIRYGVLEIIEDNDDFTVQPIQGLEGEHTWIYETSTGQILMCNNEASLNIFHKENEQFSLDTTIVLTAQLNGVLEDINGKIIWVATANGLSKLYKNENTYIYEQDTIFNFNSLNGILQDNDGYLWISTNQGLMKYHPEKAEIREFGLADGLQSLEFNFWSALKLSNGHLAFGGVNGVNVFDPLSIRDLNITAKPTITSILVEDMPWENPKCALTGATNITQIEKMNLKWWENTLSFNFAALDYSDPSANQFKYQMTGIDEAPVNNGANNFARYPDLKHGEYTFEVYASNSDGVWFGPRRLDISIKPPWWETWWARSIFAITGMGLIFAYYRYRVNQNTKRRRIQNAKKRSSSKKKRSTNNSSQKPKQLYYACK